MSLMGIPSMFCASALNPADLAVTALASEASTQSAASGSGILVPYILYFLFISFIVALVTSAIRIRKPYKIARESNRFFLTIVVGITLFSAVVYLLEWLLVRP